jgi:hypothetical protein
MRRIPVEPTRSLVEFQVQGNGEFPVDMLRYDSCWPAREATDSIAISASHRAKVSRTITLIGLREPTEGRWKSFGWKVL